MRKLLPLIIILLIIPLTVGIYAEAPPSHVDVYDYPFNITLLEGGNFTLYNNATNNIYFDGAFEGMVYCGSISGNSDCDGFNPSKTFASKANRRQQRENFSKRGYRCQLFRYGKLCGLRFNSFRRRITCKN